MRYKTTGNELKLLARLNSAAHPERSSLNQLHISALGIKEKTKTKSILLVSYSIGYASAHDHPACINILTQKSVWNGFSCKPRRGEYHG